jgi:hypothetical protein
MKTKILLIVAFLVVCVIGVLASWLLTAGVVRYFISGIESFTESLCLVKTGLPIFAIGLAISLVFAIADVIDWFDYIASKILKNN